MNRLAMNTNAACSTQRQPKWSKHALVRGQQRAIPPLICEWLCEFGTEAPGAGGAVIRFFDKRARRRLSKVMGREPVLRMKDKLSCYLVEVDGTVITVGHRTRRIRK
jgi:hypothetical protein